MIDNQSFILIERTQYKMNLKKLIAMRNYKKKICIFMLDKKSKDWTKKIKFNETFEKLLEK